MAMNWLKAGGALTGLAAALLIWTVRSPQEEVTAGHGLDPHVRGVDEVRPKRAGYGAPPRTDMVLRNGVDSRAKVRPQRVFRELDAQRPANLEANGHFQRLLEIDSARKMALLQEDQEELEQVRRELLEGERIPRAILDRALLDSNVEVRLAALYEISLSMEDPPLDLLRPVLESDPSAEVRAEALTLVAEVEGAEADELIEIALDDPDASVSVEAQEVLEARIDE